MSNCQIMSKYSMSNHQLIQDKSKVCQYWPDTDISTSTFILKILYRPLLRFISRSMFLSPSSHHPDFLTTNMYTQL